MHSKSNSNSGHQLLTKKPVKALIWAGIPLLSLGAASWASALELKAALAVVNSTIPNGTQVRDCNLWASNGTRAHIQAEARALDACGNPTNFAGGSPARITSSQVGTTASVNGVQNSIGPCGAPTQHRATLQSHVLDTSTGQELLRNHLSGTNSGCWNSNTQNGTCTSDTGGYWLNSALSQTGACTARIFRATSLGAP